MPITLIAKCGLLSLLFAVASCSATRAPIEPGSVPRAQAVSAEDEQYGHEVLSTLSEQYSLDRDDSRVNRVRDLVYRLTEHITPNQDPWHVYVFADAGFKNAAATRGNYIFIWSGIINDVQDDDELAAILAHEIGHVLAGHTNANPAEEARQMITGAAGAAAGQVLVATGQNSIVADLTEMAVKLSLQALLVNPDLQQKELEADHIGLFLMADAGFNPEKAVTFWNRMSNNPDYAGAPLEFLSSHPSSASRYTELATLLPQALDRYHARDSRLDFTSANHTRASNTKSPLLTRRSPETWIVIENTVAVFSSSSLQGIPREYLAVGATVKVVGRSNNCLEISAPIEGFVDGSGLAPYESGSSRESFTSP
jgi:predicted Zn-dependent protease